MLWSVKQFYLGPGEPHNADTVHLLDAGAAFIGGTGAGPFWRFTATGFDGDLVVTGATPADAQDNADRIAAMLNRANRARGAYPTGARIVLSMQLADDTWRFLDVTGGTITPIRDNPGGRVTLVRLTLDTLPYARGETEPATLDPATTLTNGAASVLIEGIPGTAPALPRLLIEDASTGSAVLNGVRIGVRSGIQMQAGDFDGIHDLTAAGGETVTEASAISGSVVSSVPGSAWATMAETTIPGTAYSVGLYDLYVRMRDTTVNIGAPSVLTAASVLYRLLGVGAANSGTSIGASWSAAAARSGNLLTAILKVPNGGAVTTPAGWTLRTSSVNGSSVGVYVFDRIADGTEAGVTITFATPGVVRLSVYAWSGLTTAPADKTSANTGTGTAATPGTTGTLAQALEVALLVVGRSASTSGSPASGYTELRDDVGPNIQYRVTGATTALNPSTTLSVSQPWAACIVTYRVELHGAATSSTANLTSGTYQVRVAGISSAGGVGVLTAVTSFAVSNGLMSLDWDAPSSGTPSTYRIWWNRGAGWKRISTTDARTQAVIFTETGATSEDPPNTLTGVTHLIRAAVSLTSGADTFTTAATTAALANGVNELLYLGTIPIAPLATRDDGTVEDVLVQIQGKAQAESTNALIVDAVYLFPHDEPQVEAHVAGYGLTTKRDMLIETRRDEITTGRLFAVGTTTDAGQLVVTPYPFVIGPGSAQLVIHADIAAGVSDTSDAKLDLTLTLTPRWWLPGRSGRYA